MQQNFGESLGGVGVHWDNRGVDKTEQINETIQELDRFHHNGFRIGISGVKEIKTYLELAPNLQSVWEIHVKETVDNHTMRENYQSFFPEASYLIYGINIGKSIARTSIRDSLKNRIQDRKQESKADLYFLWIKKILESHGVEKIIIGPRTLQQLESILNRMSDNFEKLA